MSTETPSKSYRTVNRSAIRRAVASSTAIETDMSTEQLEHRLAEQKPTRNVQLANRKRRP